MSNLIWNQIPFATTPDQDDELLLVNGSGETRRSTYKNLLYDQIAELTWVVTGTQSEGIGTANQWGNIPFNGLSGPDWVSLNADGSWILSAGIYFLDVGFQCSATGQVRYRLWDGSNTLVFNSAHAGTGSLQHAERRIRKRLSIDTTKTLSVQVNVTHTYIHAFYYAFGILSGFNPTIAQGFVWKVG